LVVLLWCVAACNAPSERATQDSAASAGDVTASAPRRLASDATLTVFEGTSLAAPLRALADSFAAREAVRVVHETAGAAETARKLTEVGKTPDIIVLDDARVLDAMLMASDLAWYVRFARNRVVIAYGDSSRGAAVIDSTNWWKVLQRRGVRVGHADPAIDASGYFPMLVMQLAEAHYQQRGLAAKLLAVSRVRKTPQAESDLVSSLHAGDLDYLWSLESTARDAHLRYIHLPHEIDLGDLADSTLYAAAEVTLPSADPSGDTVRVRGAPIVYGLSIPRGAPNVRYAERFLRFLLSDDGRRVLRDANVDVLNEPTVVGREVPSSILEIVGGANAATPKAAPSNTASDTLERRPPARPTDSAGRARRRADSQSRR
jgi:molybdate/tungstate transport system substrate-binding protein